MSKDWWANYVILTKILRQIRCDGVEYCQPYGSWRWNCCDWFVNFVRETIHSVCHEDVVVLHVAIMVPSTNRICIIQLKHHCTNTQHHDSFTLTRKTHRTVYMHALTSTFVSRRVSWQFPHRCPSDRPSDRDWHRHHHPTLRPHLVHRLHRLVSNHWAMEVVHGQTAYDSVGWSQMCVFVANATATNSYSIDPVRHRRLALGHSSQIPVLIYYALSFTKSARSSYIENVCERMCRTINVNIYSRVKSVECQNWAWSWSRVTSFILPTVSSIAFMKNEKIMFT